MSSLNLNNIALTALTLVTLWLSACQAEDDPNQCGRVSCEMGNVCRKVVFYNRRRYTRYPDADPHCIPCVPRGVDYVCRDNNYLQAITVGNPERSDTLMVHYCTVGKDSSCPRGSTCVRYRGLTGICCYGKLTIQPEDPQCPFLCGYYCPRRTSCQKCDQSFACLPMGQKPGDCPSSRRRFFIRCWVRNIASLVKKNFRCRLDADCPGSKKCCRDSCSRYRCLEAINRPPLDCPLPTTAAKSTTPFMTTAPPTTITAAPTTTTVAPTTTTVAPTTTTAAPTMTGPP